MPLSPSAVKKFQDDGYLIIEDFLSEEDCKCLMKECHDLVEDMDPKDHNTVFSTTKQTFRNDYFMNSADRLGYFFEDSAKNEAGELTVDKHLALNKVGHAMHVLCPNFRRVTFSDKVKEVIRSVGMVDPVIPQSMYIFKPPNIGGEVIPHQDSTFLYTEPMRLLGLWIALEDATLENGCLWMIPGSHKKGVINGYRMVRNPDPENGPSCIFMGEKPEYNDSDFVPGPVKRGSLVLIDGLVVHKSNPNTSLNSRNIYTFHIYDAKAKWSPENWLQPTERGTFEHMYDVKV